MNRRRKPADPAINRVRLEKLTIIEISEAQFEGLERGDSTESASLGLAVAVFSMAFSLTITLATVPIESNRTFYFFVIVMVAGYLATPLFGLQWWKTRRSRRKVAQEIRRRLSEEAAQEKDGEVGTASSSKDDSTN